MTDNNETTTTETPNATEQPTPENNADAGAKGQDTSTEEQADLLFDDGEKPSEDGSDQGKPKDQDSGEDGKDESDGDTPDQVDVSALEVPEDMPVPEALKGDLEAVMKDLSNPELSSQEKAQKIIDAHIKSQRHMLDNWTKTKQEWRDETLKDPDIGGDNWKESQQAANQVINEIWGGERFGGSKELLEEFKSDLSMMGLGNKRSFVKGLVNLAKAVGEDNGAGESASGGGKKDLAEILYGQSRK